MIKVLLKSKVLMSVITISLIIVSTLFFYIPIVTEKNTIETVVRNSKTNVEQIKLTRAYYVNSVVGDVKQYAPNLKFDYDHEGINGKLPFPTSTIHDLSKIFSDNTGVKFQLYSNFPFKPKEDRKLTELQKEALDFIQKDESGVWIKRDTIDGKPVLRVAVADYMTEDACVKCHNSHTDRTWQENYWNLGDKRGVLEVITPLDEDILANEIMRDKILIFIAGSLLVLVIYYSFMLIRRENELLCANDILDNRVKDEVKKNLEQQKQLTIQSRTAIMGEMMSAIIHQWKQPLNGISISNSSIDMYVNLGDCDKEILTKQTKNIKNQINYMNTTLNDFRDFFKIKKKSVFTIDSCVEDVLKLIGNVYRVQNVVIDKEFEEDLYIEGYSNELSQVIINILNNARDVILEKKPEVKTIFIKGYSTRSGVVLTITDCAGGIDPKIKKHIFEPYVTTKDEDKGTGLGLDMSKNIIEKIDGTIKAINIKTNVNGVKYKGAQFIVKFPKAKNNLN